MEFFSTIYTALNEHPTAALLVLTLVALVWVFKDARTRDIEHAKATAELNAAHLQTALQVAPLASKLVTCVEVLERLSARAGA